MYYFFNILKLYESGDDCIESLGQCNLNVMLRGEHNTDIKINGPTDVGMLYLFSKEISVYSNRDKFLFLSSPIVTRCYVNLNDNLIKSCYRE